MCTDMLHQREQAGRKTSMLIPMPVSNLVALHE
jgi:hypothetical protein